MLPASVENAISILETAEDAPLTREILVAFCVLEALKHHFPSLVQDKVRRLSERFRWIREAESSRFVKQRRIAVARIVAEMGSLQPKL
ncbi:MAG TPA: hypothetical protein VJB59_01795 [Bdellovibrionota bacterium]|nr:hypothetical protein [Bdellovibrionota bacterium]